MTVTVYGIKNCDTMKKALVWLEGKNIDFTFHNYKKQGVDEGVLRHAIEQCGWEAVINRRGTTWRLLPEEVKNTMDDQAAVTIALENPSIIKRPLLVRDGIVHLGFSEAEYKKIF